MFHPGFCGTSKNWALDNNLRYNKVNIRCISVTTIPGLYVFYSTSAHFIPKTINPSLSLSLL